MSNEEKKDKTEAAVRALAWMRDNRKRGQITIYTDKTGLVYRYDVTTVTTCG